MRLILNRCTDTDWLTHRQTDGNKKEGKSKTVVNAGPLYTENLYYPLDVGGVTLKDSLLLATAR